MILPILIMAFCLSTVSCQEGSQINNVFSKTCNQGDTNKVCEWGECCAIFTEFNVTETTKKFKCMLYSQRIVYGDYYLDQYFTGTDYHEVRYDWECQDIYTEPAVTFAPWEQINGVAEVGSMKLIPQMGLLCLVLFSYL